MLELQSREVEELSGEYDDFFDYYYYENEDYNHAKEEIPKDPKTEVIHLNWKFPLIIRIISNR